VENKSILLYRTFFSKLRKLKAAFRALPVLLLFSAALSGCGLQQDKKLDADDLRFAAFYGDYLARSGVTAKGKAAPYADLTPVELDTLFARHKLDQKTFDAKLQAYSQSPRLWRKVLERVQKDLHHKQ